MNKRRRLGITIVFILLATVLLISVYTLVLQAGYRENM